MTGPPPPPATAPPPPGAAPSGGAASPAPPPPSGRAAVPVASPFGAVIETEADRKQARTLNRRALRSLAATPEILAVCAVAFGLVGVALTFDLFAMVFASAVFVAFGWIFLVNGDSLVACLILGALGLVVVVLFSDGYFDVGDQNVLWILPALVVVLAETAVTYNNYRRRNSDISVRIGQGLWLNSAAVLGASIVLAIVLRFLTNLDGRVQWPWYAAALIVLAGAWIGGLVVLRRRAIPADQRRYSPGRRMLPPPR